MADKLRKLLFTLETADDLDQVSRFPGWKLHPLKGAMTGLWSIWVSGNWRIVFRIEGTDVTHVDLVDYH